VLDGVRGVAILLVIIWHYVYCSVGLEVGSLLAYLNRTLILTWSGVDLFFVLSGFLIVGILLNIKGSASFFKTFYTRRICRIFPLYFLMLFLFVIIYQYSDNWLFRLDGIPILSYFTFTQNFFMHNRGFGAGWLGVTWSLAIEEQFYLIIPLLVWLLNKQQLFCLFIFLICLSPVFRFIISSGFGSYVFSFARADSILMGGVLALIIRHSNARKLLLENYKYLVLSFFAFLLGICFLIIFPCEGLGGVFLHLWLAILYSLFILLAYFSNSGSIFSIILSNNVLVWLGLRSYGIYLLHLPILGIVHDFLFKGYPTISNLPALYAIKGFSLLLVFALAELSFRYYEAVFNNFGKKYSY